MFVAKEIFNGREIMRLPLVDCDACLGVWPKTDNLILELSESYAYLHEDQFFPGWTVLVLKRHATELFQLSEIERNQLMLEVSIVATTLKEVFAAEKINYALLGNVLPHIHWHVIPRLCTDPALREAPFAIPHATLHLDFAERTERLQMIREAIQNKI